MRGTIGVTDFGWYEFLLEKRLSEVNFWTPSDRRRLIAPPFSAFLFKLKAPHNAICGFGYFAQWNSLPDWLAWECFGEGNGCTNLSTLRHRIDAIRERIHFVGATRVHNIGCIQLVEPTFFLREDWIPQPEDWPVRTLSTKTYDLSVGEGQRVWEACQERVALQALLRASERLPSGGEQRYGTERLIAPRLGQATFRVAVTEAYRRSCAVTGEHSLPALEAAHIQSYASEGPHEVRNGLLLRADLHRLFDRGYLTVTPQHRLEVSSRLRADFSNGRSYYPLHGSALQLPPSLDHHPAAEFLGWHNDHVFLG
jgi:putative restriction endonuclease